MKSPAGPFDPRDVDRLFALVRACASARGMLVRELGHLGSFPLMLATPEVRKDAPDLLVAAGFHGEEPAGCWGLARFLERAPESVLRSVNLSILPVVNPTGIRAGRRVNDWGENPNSGFCHTSSGEPAPSREGTLLLEALDTILPLARAGFLSLHEDVDVERFYLYTFEQAESPGSFTDCLVQTERGFFEAVPDGPIEGAVASGGVIFRQCDGSFEDFLFHQGVPRTACTETPGALEIDRRIAANAALVEAFCRFHADLRS